MEILLAPIKKDYRVFFAVWILVFTILYYQDPNNLNAILGKKSIFKTLIISFILPYATISLYDYYMDGRIENLSQTNKALAEAVNKSIISSNPQFEKADQISKILGMGGMPGTIDSDTGKLRLGFITGKIIPSPSFFTKAPNPVPTVAKYSMNKL